MFKLAEKYGGGSSPSSSSSSPPQKGSGGLGTDAQQAALTDVQAWLGLSGDSVASRSIATYHHLLHEDFGGPTGIHLV
eukprot:COSAG01_NODE_15760_length_1302_cov_4.756442_1_plen_78_part_00